jgi:hypothetical protein
VKFRVVFHHEETIEAESAGLAAQKAVEGMRDAKALMLTVEPEVDADLDGACVQ